MFSFDLLNCRGYKFYPTLFLVIILTLPSAMTSQVSITAVDLPVMQNFNTLATSGSSALMPASWVFLETGIGANTTYTVDNGMLSTNDTYSYGTGVATERALGQLNGVISHSLGASFVNNTGTTITSLVIQFVGEQWRLGATGRTDRLDFQYSTNATAINNGVWADVNAFDFTAPVTAGAIGALDGNAAANRKVVANTLSGLSIANGATFWIRWNSFDATGNDDGLSIDDFALTANPALHYTISNAGGTLTITDTDGNSDELEVSQNGTNIRVNAPGRTYSLNAGATTSLPVDIAIAGLSNIIINTNTGHDTINVGAFTSSLPNLTINGGIDDDVVNMNGDINFLSNSFLNLDLQNDAVTPGIDQVYIAPSANLTLSGTGSATVKVSRNITLADTFNQHGA